MSLVSSIKGVEVRKENHEGRFIVAQYVKCSACDAELRVAPGGAGSVLPQEPIFKKARQNGWLPDRSGKHLCPNCHGVDDMETPEREMTQVERRKIFREIDDSYDEAGSRYCDKITDQSIATKLGVPRKWVQDIREENFGPAGTNVEVERVTSNLAKLTAQAVDAINDSMKAAAKAEDLQKEVEAMRKDLDKLKAAFGPYRVA